MEKKENCNKKTLLKARRNKVAKRVRSKERGKSRGKYRTKRFLVGMYTYGMIMLKKDLDKGADVMTEFCSKKGAREKNQKEIKEVEEVRVCVRVSRQQ